MPLLLRPGPGRTWRIRKQEPECLLWWRPRTWRHGEPNGAPPQKERYHGTHHDEERTRLNAVRKRCRALGGRAAQRGGSGRRVLLLRAHPRRLLPPLVRRAARAARECPLPRELRGGGKRRVPAVQALPAERGGSRRAPRGGRGESLPPDRGGRGDAESRGARRIREHEPLPLSQLGR